MMNQYSAFSSFEHVATGTLQVTVKAAKELLDRNPEVSILIFDNETGRQMEFDLTGTAEEAITRAEPRPKQGRPKQGRGRPKLGVNCGEVCLLPRHWEWLSAQPRSASATIRRLIDNARKNEGDQDTLRQRIAATDRFLWAIAGDLPDYEEASRALYAQNRPQFEELISAWPEDIRSHAVFLLNEYTQAERSE